MSKPVGKSSVNFICILVVTQCVHNKSYKTIVATCEGLSLTTPRPGYCAVHAKPFGVRRWHVWRQLRHSLTISVQLNSWRGCRHIGNILQNPGINLGSCLSFVNYLSWQLLAMHASHRLELPSFHFQAICHHISPVMITVSLSQVYIFHKQM